MGALPTKKLTRGYKRRRAVAYKLKPVHLSRCPQCRAAKLPHTACMNCGTYKGRQIGSVDR